LEGRISIVSSQKPGPFRHRAGGGVAAAASFSNGYPSREASARLYEELGGQPWRNMSIGLREWAHGF
jgi:hypothetical protein